MIVLISAVLFPFFFFFAANCTPSALCNCLAIHYGALFLSFSESRMMINNDAKEDNDKSSSGDLGKAVNHTSLSKMKAKGCARLGVS